MLTLSLWASHRNPELILSGPTSFRSSCSIRMNSSSIPCFVQPHLQHISETEKLGVIMSTINTPSARMKVRRRISRPHQSFPSASSVERILVTILSSSEVVDFADAHSESISRTLKPPVKREWTLPESWRLRLTVVRSCFPFNSRFKE